MSTKSAFRSFWSCDIDDWSNDACHPSNKLQF